MRSGLYISGLYRARNSRGFTLLEMAIVVAIGLTMAGVTMMALMPLFTKSHVDRAYDTTLTALRNYRNLAIAQSVRYILIPTASTGPTVPATITVQYWPYLAPPAVSPAPTTVATITLPPDVNFATMAASFPAAGPDSIGGPANAIYFQNTMTGVADNCTIVVAGEPCIVFYPDGSVQDDAQNYISGVLYLNQLNNLLSSRAIDIWGTTGRMRGWRLYSNSGGPTWVQQ
jgi:prepilin-type N-terminal cleavage/methylation domain-containing protein